MRDQPGGALRDVTLQRVEAGGDVVGRIDPLADVVQQRRLEELDIVRPAIACQLEDLEQMIENVPLRMVERRLLHVFQRQQKHAVDSVGIDGLQHAIDGAEGDALHVGLFDVIALDAREHLGVHGEVAVGIFRRRAFAAHGSEKEHKYEAGGR